jgi:hypothetical protein
MVKIDVHNYEAFLLDFFEGNLNENQIVELKSFALAHPELEINLEDTELIRLDRVEEPFDLKNNLKKNNAGKDDDIIIAYLENQLSARQKSDFEKRLNNDQFLLNQLNIYKKTILIPEKNTLFSEYQSISKTEDDLFLKNQHIAYIEGLLSEEEKNTFETELKANLDLQKEFSLYQKTYLQNDTSIIFPNKSELKKENKIFVLFSTRNLSRMAAAILLLMGFFVLYIVNKPESIQKNTIANQKVDKPNKSKLPLPISNNKIIAKSEDNSKQVVDLSHLKKRIIPEAIKDTLPKLVTQSQYLTNKTVEELPIRDSISIKAIQTALLNNSIPVLADNKIDNEVNKQFFTLDNIETEREDGESLDDSNKNKFWKRLLSIGNKVKSFGFKGFEAEKKENETYFFAFNNLSIEKK